MPDGEHDEAGDVFGASGVGRLGEEEERNEAELVDSSERRGDGCGCAYARRLPAVALGWSSGGARGEGETREMGE